MFRMIANMFSQTHGAELYRFSHDKQIHLMEARRGRGKSYNLMALFLYFATQKIPIITNTSGINFQYVAYYLMRRRVHKSISDCYDWLEENVTYARTWDNLLEAHDCAVLIDECQNIFPAKPADSTVKTPSIMYGFFQQSRKVGVTVWLLTQELPAVVTRVRVLVDWVWVVRKVQAKNSKIPQGFWMYGIDPGGAGQVDKISRTANFEYKISTPFTIEVAQTYNTHEIIRPLSGEPSYHTLHDLEQWHRSQGRIYTPDGHDELRLLCQMEHAKHPSLPTLSLDNHEQFNDYRYDYASYAA